MLCMTIQDLHTLCRTHFGTSLSCSPLFPPFLGGTRTDSFVPRCLRFPHSAACVYSIFFRRRIRMDDPKIRTCIWQVTPQRLLSFFWGVCHFGMSLRMRLQVLVQILLQFRFSHPLGYLCGVDRSPATLWVGLLPPVHPLSLFLPPVRHEPTPSVELGSICLMCLLPKGCADHKTHSSVLFTLPLEHLESLTLQGSSPHCCRSAGWAKA